MKSGIIRLLNALLMVMLVGALVQAPMAQAASVRLGIDRIDDYLALFAGKRVGLITNQTGVNSVLESSIDILYEKTKVTALYSPEHGLRGSAEAGAAVGSATDGKTGLPVYSLYGDTRKPSAPMLADIDILCFDIQDVGARFYTYVSTLALAMEAARENDRQVVVFDRPNPIGGVMVEGPILKPGQESFIGMYPIPIRHGLTVGELALLINDRFGIGCKLTVIPMSGWQREMHWRDTGLPWVMTSPNIPTPDTALVYPGIGMLGSTNLSEGIGTTRPFELVGAAWLNAEAAAARLNQAGLPGVHFRPAWFTPRFGPHSGIQQSGVQIHITDRYAYEAVSTGLTILTVMKELGDGQFGFQSTAMFDLAVGEANLRLGLESPAELLARWHQEAARFRHESRTYHLYPAK